MNYELEHQSSASAPMICAVSLWKSSHACSDGAKVRDSTVHQAGSTLRTLLHARLACVLTVFRTILLCGSGSFVGLTVVCVLLLVASSRSPQSSDCHRVFHTVFKRRV